MEKKIEKVLERYAFWNCKGKNKENKECLSCDGCNACSGCNCGA